jgi:hypothetical protein
MKKIIAAVLLISVSFTSFAQEASEKTDEGTGGFKKENLFTGGGLDLSFGTDFTVAGISPVLGYSLTKWLDAGVVFNFTYTSQRLYDDNGFVAEKVRQTDLGPGAFVRLYPTNFLFIQGQFEENYIHQNQIDEYDGLTNSFNVSASSLLLGAGYCSGREGRGGQPFFYLSVMFDVLGNQYSPYVQQNFDGSVSIIPVIKAGIQIPLFQGKQPERYTRHPRHYRGDY